MDVFLFLKNALLVYNASKEALCMDEKPVNYSLRLSPELHARLKKIAAEEDRSLQAQMLRLLDEAASRWEREHQPAGKP